VHNKLDFAFREIGVRELKNIQQPIRIYAVPPRAMIEQKSEPTARRPRTHSRLRPDMRTHKRPSGPRPSWTSELARPAFLIPVLVGAGLLLGPVLLFPTGGFFPAAGAVLLGIFLGRVFARRMEAPGNTLIGLGIGIAACAVFTNWSTVTNTLFVMSGLIVAAWGLSRNRLPHQIPR
jgi:hypothetical protein